VWALVLVVGGGGGPVRGPTLAASPALGRSDSRTGRPGCGRVASAKVRATPAGHRSWSGPFLLAGPGAQVRRSAPRSSSPPLVVVGLVLGRWPEAGGHDVLDHGLGLGNPGQVLGLQSLLVLRRGLLTHHAPPAACWSGLGPRPPRATGVSGPRRRRSGQGTAEGRASTHERAATLDRGGVEVAARPAGKRPGPVGAGSRRPAQRGGRSPPANTTWPV
jgi:hypothetical protein